MKIKSKSNVIFNSLLFSSMESNATIQLFFRSARVWTQHLHASYRCTMHFIDSWHHREWKAKEWMYRYNEFNSIMMNNVHLCLFSFYDSEWLLPTNWIWKNRWIECFKMLSILIQTIDSTRARKVRRKNYLKKNNLKIETEFLRTGDFFFCCWIGFSSCIYLFISLKW